MDLGPLAARSIFDDSFLEDEYMQDGTSSESSPQTNTSEVLYPFGMNFVIEDLELEGCMVDMTKLFEGESLLENSNNQELEQDIEEFKNAAVEDGLGDILFAGTESSSSELLNCVLFETISPNEVLPPAQSTSSPDFENSLLSKSASPAFSDEPQSYIGSNDENDLASNADESSINESMLLEESFINESLSESSISIETLEKSSDYPKDTHDGECSGIITKRKCNFEDEENARKKPCREGVFKMQTAPAEETKTPIEKVKTLRLHRPVVRNNVDRSSLSDSEAQQHLAASPTRPKSAFGMGKNRKQIVNCMQDPANISEAESQDESEAEFAGFSPIRSQYDPTLAQVADTTDHVFDKVHNELPSRSVVLTEADHSFNIEGENYTLFSNEDILEPLNTTEAIAARRSKQLVLSPYDGTPTKKIKKTVKASKGKKMISRCPQTPKKSNQPIPRLVSVSDIEAPPPSSASNLPTSNRAPPIAGKDMQLAAKTQSLRAKSGRLHQGTYYHNNDNDSEIEFIDEVQSKVKPGAAPRVMKPPPIVRNLVTKPQAAVNLYIHIPTIGDMDPDHLAKFVQSIETINKNDSLNRPASAGGSGLNLTIHALGKNKPAEAVKQEVVEQEVICLSSDDEAEVYTSNSWASNAPHNSSVVLKQEINTEVLPRVMKVEMRTPMHTASSPNNSTAPVKKIPVKEYLKMKGANTQKKFIAVQSKTPGAISFMRTPQHTPQYASSTPYQVVAAPQHTGSTPFHVMSTPQHTVSMISSSPPSVTSPQQTGAKSGKTFTIVKRNNVTDQTRTVPNKQIKVCSIRQEVGTIVKNNLSTSFNTGHQMCAIKSPDINEMMAFQRKDTEASDDFSDAFEKSKKKRYKTKKCNGSIGGSSTPSSDCSTDTDTCPEDEGGNSRSLSPKRRKSRSKKKRGRKRVSGFRSETESDNTDGSSSELTDFEVKRLNERKVRQRSQSLSPKSLYRVGCVCNKGNVNRVGHSKSCKFYKSQVSSPRVNNINFIQNHHHTTIVHHNHFHGTDHSRSRYNQIAASNYDAPPYRNAQESLGSMKLIQNVAYDSRQYHVKSSINYNNRSATSQSQSFRSIQSGVTSQTEKQHTVYIGRISKTTTKDYLRGRFEKFGHILNVQTIFRDVQDSYAFVTYSNGEAVEQAIAHGNDGHQVEFEIGYGGRRQFCQQDYRDLDAAPASPSRSPVEELNFDNLLKDHIRKQ